MPRDLEDQLAQELQYEFEDQYETGLEMEGGPERALAPPCPVPRREIVSRFPRYQNTVRSLPMAEQQKLRSIANVIRQSFRPGCRHMRTVRLVGHADRDVQRGPAFESRISVERARAVEQALKQLLGPAISSQITWPSRGVGASALVVPNPRNEPERARNRRVEILLSRGAPNRWDHAVEENRRLAQALAWQAYRSSIIHLLGSKSIPNEYVFAEAVARWQRAQRNLPANGIIGHETLKRMIAALRYVRPSSARVPSRETSFHEVASDPDEMRRLYLEFRHEIDDPQRFATDPIPALTEGHSSMTRRVAGAFPALKPEDVEALVEGSRRPDKVPPTLNEQTDECQQRRHALRGRLCQEIGPALGDIRGHLTKLYEDALATPDKPRYDLIGEALHLIQDSYSPAHTERSELLGPPYLGLITYIRVWNPASPGNPTEHGWPVDTRDRLDLLSPQGVAASTASREFLQMVLRHIEHPSSPSNKAELVAFMNRHLALDSSGYQTVAYLIRLATRPFDPDPRYLSYLRCLVPDGPKPC